MDKSAWSSAGRGRAGDPQFEWQPNLTLLISSYIINEFFSVVFNPPIFRLKGHHSKLCEIKVSVFDRLVNFRRIPIVLEVHRILDRATLIAKAELEEIESIDDPKWKEDSYVEHVYLHLNIRTIVKPASEASDELDAGDKIDPTAGPVPCSQFGHGSGMPPESVNLPAAGGGGDGPPPAPVMSPAMIEEQRKEAERKETISRLMAKNKLTSNEIIELSMAIDQRITIFEKLFWKYLSKSKFMRINPERKRVKAVKTYEQVIASDIEQNPDNNSEADRK